jgi:DNA-binding NtrC family response regulator
MPDTPKHLLLVEDEAPLREAVAEQLADRGFDVVQAESAERALDALADFAFDIVVTDLRLPGMDGTRVIEAAVDRYPDIIGIVITGYGTVKDAVEVIKRGAADFVTKPFQFDELWHALQGAIEQRRLRTENAWLREQLQQRFSFEGIVGRSRAMRDLFQVLQTVASSASTILISGETGTGKEVVARAIHHASPRRAHRFVAINCSAIPENLLEAELFGHARGAFTGAIANRQGRLEQAHRGTLFLDEVGTMSMALQMKLLRVLQEREFERVGDSQTIKVDVRVIAATNKDLEAEIEKGNFREDLYFRLSVIPIRVPPLRDRRDDIPALVRHFADLFSRDNNRRPQRFTPAALEYLQRARWKGNVRELKNTVERLIIMTPGEVIDVDDLRDIVRLEAKATSGDNEKERPGTLREFKESAERTFLVGKLRENNWNISKTAEVIGTPRSNLYKKLEQYGISQEVDG